MPKSSITSSGETPLPLLAFRLRALVLALGESVHPPWWKTQFMNETGFRFLERLYPRTYLQAAVFAAGKAACAVHDLSVGRVAVYHLFRLPEAIEIDVGHLAKTSDGELFASFRSVVMDTQRLLELLERLCEPQAIEAAEPGARKLGSEKDWLGRNGLKRVGAVYYWAFRQGMTVFPYATEDRKEGFRW